MALLSTKTGVVNLIPSESMLVDNLSISASVAANALTINLLDKAGSTPSVGSPVSIGFRNSSNTVGTYNVRTVIAALSMVVSSGSTLGQTSAVAYPVYIYAIDNAGTVELAVSTTLFDTGAIVSTTAEGGAGAADSINVIYSTTARSNVPIRLIGKIISTQATAGTWASAPSLVQNGIDAGSMVDSGFYTPIFTNSTNISASSPYVSLWCKVGQLVTVTGAGEVTCTAAGSTYSELGISLPIPSSLTLSTDLSGVGSRDATAGTPQTVAQLSANAALDRAFFTFNSSQTTNKTITFMFQYLLK